MEGGGRWDVRGGDLMLFAGEGRGSFVGGISDWTFRLLKLLFEV